MNGLHSSHLAATFLLGLAACGTGGTGDTGDGTAGPDARPADGPIEFINLRVAEIGPNRAMVRFDTSVPTTCEVEFGTTATDLPLTGVDPDMEPGQLAVQHNVPLEDLRADTTYYIRAKGTDANDVTARSDVMAFATLSAAGDPTMAMNNVALVGADAVVMEVSSNWSSGANDSGFGINNALDGSMNTEWSTNGDGNDAFVEIDLGAANAAKPLRYFAYRSRMMTDGTSIVTKVRLILDGTTVLGPFATPDHTVRYVFPIDPPLSARRVRFEAVETTGGNTGAKEIQLFTAN